MNSLFDINRDGVVDGNDLAIFEAYKSGSLSSIQLLNRIDSIKQVVSVDTAISILNGSVEDSFCFVEPERIILTDDQKEFFSEHVCCLDVILYHDEKCFKIPSNILYKKNNSEQGVTYKNCNIRLAFEPHYRDFVYLMDAFWTIMSVTRSPLYFDCEAKVKLRTRRMKGQP